MRWCQSVRYRVKSRARDTEAGGAEELGLRSGTTVLDVIGQVGVDPVRAFQPTAYLDHDDPGVAAAFDLVERSSILLDDGSSSQNPDLSRHPNGQPFTLANRFRGGDSVADLTGVIDYSFGRYRVLPTQGADNAEEFTRQRDKIFAALAIPSAGYGHPMLTPTGTYKFLTGQSPTPMCELGWKSVGVLELTALPSLDRDRWVQWVEEADVLLVNGGDALYLTHWMRESGLADLLPTLEDTVWVGLSAGSMAMSPRIGQEFVHWEPPAGDDSALRLVDFSIFPHVDHPDLPTNTMAAAERWAARLGNRAYAIDDDTAFKVLDGEVEVVSEGNWKLLVH